MALTLEGIQNIWRVAFGTDTSELISVLHRTHSIPFECLSLYAPYDRDLFADSNRSAPI
jgi:hypothetical protein